MLFTRHYTNSEVLIEPPAATTLRKEERFALTTAVTLTRRKGLRRCFAATVGCTRWMPVVAPVGDPPQDVHESLVGQRQTVGSVFRLSLKPPFMAYRASKRTFCRAVKGCAAARPGSRCAG